MNVLIHNLANTEEMKRKECSLPDNYNMYKTERGKSNLFFFFGSIQKCQNNRALCIYRISDAPNEIYFRVNYLLGRERKTAL